MKHQYFGDINDYRKYGLLRQLAALGLRVGVHWMLTADDGRADGELRLYLRRPEKWRCHDPELYDRLSRLLGPGTNRSVHCAVEWNLIPAALYHSEPMPRGVAARDSHLKTALESLSKADVLFFDPDNGIEVSSVSRGSQHAPKYVRWDEIDRAYRCGHSVLVYQHYPRRPRKDFEREVCQRLMDGLTAPYRIELFSTANVVFFCVAQAAHAERIAQAAARVQVVWGRQIRYHVFGGPEV